MVRNAGLPRRLPADTARRAPSFRIIGEVISELRRVTWPTRQETIRLTWMVIGVAAAIGAFLGLIDIGFARLMDFILRRGA